jgi:hypothetical protein
MLEPSQSLLISRKMFKPILPVRTAITVQKLIALWQALIMNLPYFTMRAHVYIDCSNNAFAVC